MLSFWDNEVVECRLILVVNPSFTYIRVFSKKISTNYTRRSWAQNTVHPMVCILPISVENAPDFKGLWVFWRGILDFMHSAMHYCRLPFAFTGNLFPLTWAWFGGGSIKPPVLFSLLLREKVEGNYFVKKKKDRSLSLGHASPILSSLFFSQIQNASFVRNRREEFQRDMVMARTTSGECAAKITVVSSSY